MVFPSKCLDAFRITLTKEQKLLIKQKHGKDSQLSTLLSSPFIKNLFILRLRETAGKGLKKILHNFKKKICKQRQKHIQEAYPQLTGNQLVIK